MIIDCFVEIDCIEAKVEAGDYLGDYYSYSQ